MLWVKHGMWSHALARVFFWKCSLVGKIAFVGRENVKKKTTTSFVIVWGGGGFNT